MLNSFILSHNVKNTSTSWNCGRNNPHKTSQNLFWHSYYLWEFESQIRALGDEYSCFALPFWDLTVDGELWSEDGVNVDDLPLFNSMLGGPGDEEQSHCVVEDPWSVTDYTTDYLCADGEDEGSCCLKRVNGAGSDEADLWNRRNLTNVVLTKDFKVHGTEVTMSIIAQ